MKMTYFAAAAIGALVMVPAVQAKPMKAAKAPACAPGSAAAVEGLFTQFNDSWATKDPAKVTALFTKDAVLLPTVSHTPRTTPEGVNDYFVKFLKGSPVGSIDTSTVSVGCNIATRLGTWTVKLTDAKTGAVSNVKARYSFIYKPEGGVWKIYHLHSSMMPEPIA